jgi:L-ascorbate metabolism protein UlaG (beta-lactamase superfamily)
VRQLIATTASVRALFVACALSLAAPALAERKLVKQRKVRRVFVPLGVGAHLERWGYARDRIREADWFDRLELNDGLVIHAVPARHCSGRWLSRNRTLRAGFVLESAKRRLLFSGDTGYGPHVKELAGRFGGFDPAALDMGQYDARWPYIHLTPEEAAQAAEELQAKALLPAHVGRFSIARHPWDEPFERITAASGGKPYRLLTPVIGEPVRLADEGQQFTRWWEDAKRVASRSDLVRRP